MIYYTGHTIEPLRLTVNEFSVNDQGLTHTVLIPEQDEQVMTTAPYGS